MTPEIEKRLMKNWGEQHSAMNAELRYFDPIGSWECYIYAIDPEKPDTFEALINGYSLEQRQMTFTELFSMYNAEGEGVKLDTEFRPRQVYEIEKRLNQKR
jgi:hypothetical protein